MQNTSNITSFGLARYIHYKIFKNAEISDNCIILLLEHEWSSDVSDGHPGPVRCPAPWPAARSTQSEQRQRHLPQLLHHLCSRGVSPNCHHRCLFVSSIVTLLHDYIVTLLHRYTST